MVRSRSSRPRCSYCLCLELCNMQCFLLITKLAQCSDLSKGLTTWEKYYPPASDHSLTRGTSQRSSTALRVVRYAAALLCRMQHTWLVCRPDAVSKPASSCQSNRVSNNMYVAIGAKPIKNNTKETNEEILFKTGKDTITLHMSSSCNHYSA